MKSLTIGYIHYREDPLYNILWYPVLISCTVFSPTVMLQPFDPNSADKNKHKFMVQTMFAPPDFQSDQLDIVVCSHKILNPEPDM